MFKNPPKVIGHISALKHGPFVGQEYIMTKVDDEIRLLNRLCPHRFYPIGDLGNIENITCKLHGFSFNADGSSKNNPYKLSCHSNNVGKSGIVFRNFTEPNHKWVDIISNEKDLEFHHTLTGKSYGSWLWQMEIQTDLSHIRKNGIHPCLSNQVNLNSVKMEEGDGWIYQEHDTGFWLFVFPYGFIEWSNGCLGINSIYPNDSKNEFGYSWTTQFYFDNKVNMTNRYEFMKLEEAFKEDVLATELQVVPYVPYKSSIDRLEDHVVTFSKWIDKNRI